MRNLLVISTLFLVTDGRKLKGHLVKIQAKTYTMQLTKAPALYKAKVEWVYELC